MHDPTAPEIRSGPPPSVPSESGITARPPRFPGGETPPGWDTFLIFSRIVLPLTLFVTVIGIVAWIKINSRTIGPDNPGPGTKSATLHFPKNQADWGNPKDLDYRAEFERGGKGHYDFPFDNPADEPMELGLMYSNCDCSNVQGVVVPDQATQDKPPQDLKWEKMKFVEKTKIPVNWLTVPPRAKGLVRVGWDLSRKAEGEGLQVKVELLARPKGGKTTKVDLNTQILVVPPVQFVHSRIDVGELGFREKSQVSFDCWSATRAALNLTVTNDDPLFHWQLTPLSAKQCQDLQDHLKNKIRNTRVKSAYRIDLTVHEQKGKRQLDQGSFHRFPLLLLDGEPLETKGTMIQGRVTGDFEIKGTVRTGSITQGQIRFGTFAGNQGTQATVTLRGDKTLGLTLLKAKVKPQFLKVQLVETKEVIRNKKTWHLEVEVPKDCPNGQFPADSVIILRTQTTPPRHIRIPVLGIAVQG